VPNRSAVNIAAEARAKSRGVDLREELRSMRDWAKGNAERKADWDATWRNWIRRAKPTAASKASQSQSVLTNLLGDIAELERKEALKA
jgi:hypothetical protein